MSEAEAKLDTAPRTLADRALDALQDDIVRGVIAPGARVSESDLAARYGVSRGPMREVIRRLESRKLLERKVHVGTRVAALDPARLAELYYLREALEGMAARMAATAMDDDEIAGLYRLLAEHEQQQDLKEDIGYFQREGDLDFHYRVIQGSHNAALADMLIGELYYLIRMSRYQFSGVAKRPRQALKEHRQIVEAIEARDGELAEMLMRRHISRARRNIEADNRPEAQQNRNLKEERT